MDKMREAFDERWKRNVSVDTRASEEPILKSMLNEFAAGYDAAQAEAQQTIANQKAIIDEQNRVFIQVDELYKNSMAERKELRKEMEEMQQTIAGLKLEQRIKESQEQRSQEQRSHEQRIKVAVDRFLGWRLPDSICPDHYISFDRKSAIELRIRTNGNAWPCGTNFLSADEAKEMFEYCLAAPVIPKKDMPLL